MEINKKYINKNILALSLLFIGTAISAISTIVTTIVITKYTTVIEFGNYSAILATIITFAPLCGFGIAQYWLKLFGEHSSYGIVWLKKSLLFITMSSIIVFTLLIIWFYITLESHYLVITSIFLSFFVFKRVSVEIVNSILQINNKYIYLSLWQIFHTSLLLLFIVVFTYFYTIDLDEYKIAIMQFVVAIVSILIAIYLIQKFNTKYKKIILESKLKEFKDKYNPSITNIFKESSYFGISSMFYLIYYQFGVVFVRYINGSEEAAFYSVAFTFLTAALLVPSVIYQKFLLPKLHRWAYHDNDKFIKSYYYGNYIMFALGILGLLFFYFFSEYFVNLFFGSRYIDAIPLVKIMAINIPIVYLASSAGSLLVTKDHMKTKVYYMGFAALLSLILNIPMINYFGTAGAIYTNIISNIFILAIYFYKVEKSILIKSKNNDR